MSDWISVEDRLPELSQWFGEVEVLIAVLAPNGVDKFVTTGSLMDAEHMRWEVADVDAYGDHIEYWNSDVTHWQPLPSPPK